METSNAYIHFSTAYYTLGANVDTSVPEFVQCTVTGKAPQNWQVPFWLPITKVSAKMIQSKCAFIRFDDTPRNIDRKLLDEIQVGLQSKKIAAGYFFHKSGAILFPDGLVRFLRGAELFPDNSSIPYIVAPEIEDIELAGRGDTPLHECISALMSAPLQALLTIAYVILSSVRSLVISEGINLQAVLYIVGGQGLGKTTLATRLAGIYQSRSNKCPSAVVQAGSSIAAIESLLITHRDQPVIVDDLCLSDGKDTERKRRELGAKLIREGAGNSPIIKKAGKTTKEFYCNAGVILTAEFSLENLSDLTRCLIVPVNDQLHLSAQLTPELMGDILRHYSCWFIANSVQELNRLQENLDEEWQLNLEPRVRTNYCCLRWAFQSLIRSLGGASDTRKELLTQMDHAIELAIAEHMKLQRGILDQLPIGNLAACVYSGYKEGAFDLARKIEKLPKYEGILWKKDLCLRPEALIRFVRLQPGFRNWTRNRISRELKDLGALILQEEGTSTVHLDSSSPRVYRIRLDVLKKAMEYY